MTRGDLSPTTTPGQGAESRFERKLRLLAIPAASHARGNVLPPCDLHPEAVEAQRAWPEGRGIVALIPEAVPGFARPAARAQWHSQWRLPLCRSSRWPDTRSCVRTAIQRQLTLVFSQCLGHVSLLTESRVSEGCDRLGHVGKTEDDDIDALFQLPPPEFVAARNALATQLKKAGRDVLSSQVKTLPKPSVSAWTVNQLYWKHRAAFDKLLTNGERFRQAQVSRLAGKNTDIHKLLNERREELSAISRLAAEILQRSSGAAPPGVMRRITATLEALSAYGTVEGAPKAGRLVEDVDPPGFDALAALVPRVGDGSRAVVPSKVLTFQKEPKARKSKSKSVEVREQEKREQLKAARDAKQEATRELASAKRMALQSQSALKKAAAHARETEETMVETEARLQKVAEIAHEARQKARRAAVEAESAAQAVEEAERTLERATEALSELEDT